MELTQTELGRLEALATRAREDAAYRDTLLKDPRAVIAEDADVTIPADARLRTLYASDADFTVVLPGEAGASQPSLVVLFEESVLDENAVFDQLKALAPHVEELSRRSQQDAGFRQSLVGEPTQTLDQAFGVKVDWRFQVVDPRDADLTLVFPVRSADQKATPVVELPSFAAGAPEGPGSQVLIIESGSGELSEDALEMVAGGTGTSGKGQPRPGGKG